MQITTALNHEKRLLTDASAIFSSARWGGDSHAELLKRIHTRIYQDPAYQKCPRWVRANVNRRIRDNFDGIYQPQLSGNDLEKIASTGDTSRVPYVRWQLRVDGKHTSSNEISDRRANGDPDIWSRVEGAHIWNHRPERTYSDGGWQNTSQKA